MGREYRENQNHRQSRKYKEGLSESSKGDLRYLCVSLCFLPIYPKRSLSFCLLLLCVSFCRISLCKQLSVRTVFLSSSTLFSLVSSQHSCSHHHSLFSWATSHMWLSSLPYLNLGALTSLCHSVSLLPFPCASSGRKSLSRPLSNIPASHTLALCRVLY